jgi:hypothetical protein
MIPDPQPKQSAELAAQRLSGGTWKSPCQKILSNNPDYPAKTDQRIWPRMNTNEHE